MGTREPQYNVGDIVNGHILGNDMVWHPLVGKKDKVEPRKEKAPLSDVDRRIRKRRMVFGGALAFVVVLIVLTLTTGTPSGIVTTIIVGLVLLGMGVSLMSSRNYSGSSPKPRKYNSQVWLREQGALGGGRVSLVEKGEYVVERASGFLLVKDGAEVEWYPDSFESKVDFSQPITVSPESALLGATGIVVHLILHPSRKGYCLVEFRSEYETVSFTAPAQDAVNVYRSLISAGFARDELADMLKYSVVSTTVGIMDGDVKGYVQWAGHPEDGLHIEVGDGNSYYTPFDSDLADFLMSRGMEFNPPDETWRNYWFDIPVMKDGPKMSYEAFLGEAADLIRSLKQALDMYYTKGNF